MDTTIAVGLDYIQAGRKAIPLKPNSKQPMFRGYQTIDPIDQLCAAPYDCNLGLIDQCAIDCDTWQFTIKADDTLRRLGGKDVPYHVTGPRGKPRYLLNVQNIPDGCRAHHISGQGSLLLDGWMVVVPPSVIDGKPYTGPFVLEYPTFDYYDLIDSFKIPIYAPSNGSAALPFPLPYRPLKDYAKKTRDDLYRAKKGDPIKNYRYGDEFGRYDNEFYPTKSEAELAYTMHCALRGWNKEQIRQTLTYPRALERFDMVYYGAINAITGTANRQKIASLYIPEPKTTKDKTYNALLAVAYITDRVERIGAGYDQLMEITGLSKDQIRHSLGLLITEGKITTDNHYVPHSKTKQYDLVIKKNSDLKNIIVI